LESKPFETRVRGVARRVVVVVARRQPPPSRVWVGARWLESTPAFGARVPVGGGGAAGEREDGGWRRSSLKVRCFRVANPHDNSGEMSCVMVYPWMIPGG
jgi:hypothetical protein